MSQLALLEDEPLPDAPREMRPYQVAAVEAIRSALSEVRSAVLVMATGVGKTEVAGELVRSWPGRVLFVAHRDELLQQAQNRLSGMTGEPVDLEQASFRAGDARLVVASIQSISRPDRLGRFRPDSFGLVVVDECHHSPAATYRRVIDYFSGAKVLGLTATPDRQDEKALGQIFDKVAHVYEIAQAIKDGWLCPIVCTRVHVDAIDLAAVRTTAGDLNQGDLDAVMAAENAMHGVVRPTLELAGARRTLVFTTGVATAHRMAEIFCRYRAGCARAVDGETPRDERRAILRDHKDGKFQFLVNVGIATEGYDDPGIACIAQARPTESRALFAQCVGRGLRIAPGKEDCLVLDFVGNSGKHRLMSAVDILGGEYSDEEVERARKISERTPGGKAQDALEQARVEVEHEARRRAVQARVKYRTATVDPFAVFGTEDPMVDGFARRFGARPASEAQMATLRKFKVDIPANCTTFQAGRLLDKAIGRARQHLCTYGQLKLLLKYGINGKSFSFARASEAIDAIARNGWRYVAPAAREPGEDG